MIWTRLVPYGLAVAMVLAALFGAYRHGVTAERTRQELAAQTERAEAARMIIDEQNRSADRAAALDAKYTGELRDAYAEIDRLSRPDAAGQPVRVFVKAKCPAPGPVAMPEADAPAGVGDRGQPLAELDGAAREDYLALLRHIRLKETALAACVEAHNPE